MKMQFWPALLILALASCGEPPSQTAAKQETDSGQPAEPLSVPPPSDVAAPPPDAAVLESGIAYQVSKPGTGTEHATLDDSVVVHYTGWTTDGAMFDSSVLRGEPAEFPLNRLIEGWQLAIPHMVVGEKARFWIPGRLAYDNRPDRPNAPKGMLVFEVELLAIKPGEAATAAK